jgi:PRC-barrel domain
VPDAAVHEQTYAGGARSAALKRGAGYMVYDPVGQRIGSAEEVFANRAGEPVYIRVNIGFLFSRTVLIPVQFVQTMKVKPSS